MALSFSKSLATSRGVCCPTRVVNSHRRASTVQRAFLDSLKSIFTGDVAAKERKSLETKLLESVKGTKRGLETSKEQESIINSTVDSLQELWLDKPTTTTELSATWRLLWTTEKETLFILSNAGFFGTEAGDVLQVIDVDAELLQNAIVFPPEGAFLVDSAITVAGPQRMDFQFKSATLQLPNRNINLPPFGKGWFDTVYLSSTLRISKDSRGDTLIVERDGPPRFMGNDQE